MADGDTQPSTGLLGALQNVPILGGLLGGGGQGAGYNAALYGGALNDPATEQAMRTRQLGAMAAAFAQGAEPTPYKGGLLQFARTLGNVGYASTIANDSTMDARLKNAQAMLAAAQAGNQNAMMNLRGALGKAYSNFPGAEPEGGTTGTAQGGPTSRQVAGAANAFDTGDPFLNLVALHESKYNPFVGTGGTDLSKTPLDNTGFPVWDGIKTTNPVTGKPDVSTAAGLFQITGSNWHKYAPDLIASGAMKPDFSVPSQIAVAKAMMAANGKSDWLPYNKNLAAADARGDTVPVPGAGGPPGTAPPLVPGGPTAPGDQPAAAAGAPGGLLANDPRFNIPNLSGQLAAPGGAAAPGPAPAAAPAPTGLLMPQGGSPDVASPLVRAAAAQAADANIPGARPGAPSVGAPGPGPAGPLLAGPGATGGNLVPGGGANLPIPQVTTGPPAGPPPNLLQQPPAAAPAGGAPGPQTAPGATPAPAAPPAPPAPSSAPAVLPGLPPQLVPPGMKISNAQIDWAKNVSALHSLLGEQAPAWVTALSQLPTDLAKQEQDARVKAFYDLQTAGLKPYDMRENTLHRDPQTGNYAGNFVVVGADNRPHRVLVTGGMNGPGQIQDLGPAQLSPQETAAATAAGPYTPASVPGAGIKAPPGSPPIYPDNPDPAKAIRTPTGTVIPPATSQVLPQNYGDYKAQQDQWNERRTDLVNAQTLSAGAETKIRMMIDAAKVNEMGPGTEGRARLGGLLITLGADQNWVNQNITNVGAVQQFLYGQARETLGTLAAVNKRFTGGEFNITSQSGAGTEYLNAANLPILADDLARVRQLQMVSQDFNRAQGIRYNDGGYWNNPESFISQWYTANPLGKIKAQTMQQIGPLAGQKSVPGVPPEAVPTGKSVGGWPVFRMPDGREGTFPGEWR